MYSSTTVDVSQLIEVWDLGFVVGCLEHLAQPKLPDRLQNLHQAFYLDATYGF